MRWVNPDATLRNPQFEETDYASELIGEAIRTGPQTFDYSLIGYGVKERAGDRNEIMYLFVVNGSLTCLDDTNVASDVTLSVYTADQDADHDGLPDEGAEPMCHGPTDFGTAKRVPMMPRCESPPEEAQLDPEMITEIEAIVEDMMEATGLPGFALGVVKDGAPVYAQGFGVANVETNEPVTPQTVFQLAEVTMAPTTLAMLQLADAGEIDLDAPITEYLPYFEMAGEGWEEITVRHLLLQTSGVPDSGDAAADWTTLTPELDDEAVERLVRGLADTEMLFAAGEGFEWSDIGFHIAGDIVAKVTGKPYED